MLALHRHSFKSLGGANEIQLYSKPGECDLLFSRAVAECRRIEEKFSRFRETSLLSKINRAAGTAEKTLVDDETAALLNYAARAYETSDQLFDITSGVLSRLWNFREKKIPAQNRIDAVRPLVGWSKVEWRPPSFRLPLAGMEIDFGGFGKEYAVDRVATLLFEHGVRHGLVNLGGDLRILGSHPDGAPWAIGISHPRLAKETLASVSAAAGAIATSGDYERFFEIDGRRFCHIINPKTGQPAEGIQAVTVFSESCIVAGTAATVAMLKGPKSGRDYLEELGIPYILVRDAESIVTQFFNLPSSSR